jgi:threonine dehydratase
VISAQDIEAAAARIGGRVRVTPTIDLEPGDLDCPARLTLKLELLQHTGSFKVRGALNRILSAAVPAAGVLAASGGNHGAAVAWAAQQLGHRAEIFVPESTPALKVERLRSYGARVVETGSCYAEALAASSVRAAETGALVVHAYDQDEVIAGQGTVGRELERQRPDLDACLVAVAGGGLIGGMASWYAGRLRLVGVEPERCPTLARALEAGRPVDVEVGGCAMDSLGAGRVGERTFPIARRWVERVVLVTDAEILRAQRLLWDRLRVLAEPGGAAALAGLLFGDERPRAGERVGVVVCGGNTDPASVA